MSKYTTGEAAKMCGVSVRTVQYYDSRGILAPTEISEGGRRLYSQGDITRLKVICALRDMGISINAIAGILEEERPGDVIGLILSEQAKALREEISERQAQLENVERMQQMAEMWPEFSVESINDIAHIMENRKKLRRTRMIMGVTAGIAGVVQWGSFIYWIVTGNWRLFAVGYPLVILWCIWLVRFYFKRVSYICPKCHGVFKPGVKEFLFAKHTFATRKLTCKCCGHHGYCVETADE